MRPEDMVICSLNVRGLSNNTKRRLLVENDAYSKHLDTTLHVD